MAPAHPNRGRTPGPAANPSADEVRQLRESASLSMADAAMLVLSTLRSWQNWETPPDSPESRRMPPGLWLLFRVRVKLLQGDPAGALELLRS